MEKMSHKKRILNLKFNGKNVVSDELYHFILENIENLSFPNESHRTVINEFFINNKYITEIAILMNKTPTCTRSKLLSAIFNIDNYYKLINSEKINSKECDLDIPISNYSFSQRTLNCLNGNNIFYFSDLIKNSPNDLMNLSNFGVRSMEEVKNALVEMNVPKSMCSHFFVNDNKTMVNKNNWILIEDRIPPIGVCVLVCMCDTNKNPPFQSVRLAIRALGDFMWLDENENPIKLRNEIVLAWMWIPDTVQLSEKVLFKK